MTTTTAVATDPAQVAADNIWPDKAIGDTSIDAKTMAKLLDADIETFGQLDALTLQGDAPKRLESTTKLTKAEAKEVLSLLEQAKAAALEEVNQTPAEPQAEPSRGSDGYTLKMAAKLGRYGSSGLSCSIRATVGVAGESGVVGIRPGTAVRSFCGTQLDVEIGQGDQGNLHEDGPFHAVGKTAGVSFNADRTEVSFTMTFVMSAVNHSRLETYANGDVMLRANVIDDAGEGAEEHEEYEDA